MRERERPTFEKIIYFTVHCTGTHTYLKVNGRNIKLQRTKPVQPEWNKLRLIKLNKKKFNSTAEEVDYSAIVETLAVDLP